jgi:hypothetical protein
LDDTRESAARQDGGVSFCHEVGTMPDVGKYETEDDWMGACVPKMVDEGKSQDQAVAACLNQWRNKEEAKESLWQKAKELLEHLMPQSKEDRRKK